MAAWVELSVVVPSGLVEEVCALFGGLGAEGVQEDHLEGEKPAPRQPWDTGPEAPLPERMVVRGWWPGEMTTGLMETLQEVFADIAGAELGELRPVPEEDWAEGWKKGFRRIEIGPTLVVAPPWEAKPGDLIIEPGMAFGTGEHATTLACLAGVARFARAGGRCLDVGTGTGVLALAAARLGMRAWGTDNDPLAVEASKKNAELNGLEARFDDSPLENIQDGPYDLVVANLFAEVLIALAPELLRLCGGTLILAGILADRADRVEAAFPGFARMERTPAGDWVSFIFER
jgi:ribosomal protein L11 methyltransferase